MPRIPPLKLLLSFLKTSRTSFLLPFSDSQRPVHSCSVPGTDTATPKSPKSLLRVHTAQPGGVQRNPARRFPTLIITGALGMQTKDSCFVSGKTWGLSKQESPRRDLEKDSSHWEQGSGSGDAGHYGKVTRPNTWLSPLLLSTTLGTEPVTEHMTQGPRLPPAFISPPEG